MSRTLLKSITRFLYAGGTIVLLAGMLLSAFNKPALASGITVTTQSSGKASTLLLAAPGPFDTLNKGNPTGASLVFSGGCDANCKKVQAQVCNHGDGNMVESVGVYLYYAASGNPKDGSLIASSQIGPLAAGACQTLSHTPDASGNYMWKVMQESTHPGKGELWSDTCQVSAICTPEVTETVVVTETPVVTETVVVTETPEVTETVEVTETPEETETVVVTEEPEVTETVAVTETVEVTETPVETETVEVTETPEETETVVVTEEPEVTETVAVTETVEVTKTPEETETVEVTETAEVTETPEETETVVVTEEPEETETPEVTETVEVTEEPEETETAVVTEEPEVTETAVVTEEPQVTETTVVTEAPPVTATEGVAETPVATETQPAVETPVVTESPEATVTEAPADTNVETPVPTLSAPEPQNNQAAVLIPVTGVDLSNPGAGSLGGLFTNLGLLILGIAMVLTGINNRLN